MADSDEQIGVFSDSLARQFDDESDSFFLDEKVQDSSVHEFSEFAYVLEPDWQAWEPSADLTRQAGDYLAGVKSGGAAPELVQLLTQFLPDLEAAILSGLRLGFAGSYLSQAEKRTRLSMASREARQLLYGRDRAAIPDLLDLYVLDPDRLLSDFVQADLSRRAWDLLVTRLGGINRRMPAPADAGIVDNDGKVIVPPSDPEPRRPWSWLDRAADWLTRWTEDGTDGGQIDTAGLLEYPFEVFPAGSTNVGLALVYRQDWTLLGTQPGEIVKTIPLGPGQTEKVSTKITRRNKHIQRTEMSSESESTTTTNDTTKDSSDIVLEAGRTAEQGFEASIEAGFPSIGLGGSASGKMSESLTNTSRDTTSSLSERMEKTAQKLKRRSKVSVSTELEDEYTREHATEIINENQEIGVTYCYHTMQRRYEVFTRLSEVRNCLFVAEALPPPSQVREDWVRRHAIVLAKVILDASLLPIIDEIANDAEERPTNVQRYEDMLAAAQDKFATFEIDGSGQGDGFGAGLSIPDIYSEPQRLLDRHLRDTEEIERANRVRKIRRQRLFDHLRMNILHYCRAIWLSEDPDQRLLRYKKEGRTIALNWTADPADLPGDLSFQPGEIEAPIYDLIDPTGPIGAFGNYLIFGLRPMSEAARDAILTEGDDAQGLVLSLHDVLDLERAKFSDGRGNLRDPALASFEAEAKQMLADTPELLTGMGDERVLEVLSYLPDLAPGRIQEDGTVIRNAELLLEKPFTEAEFARFLWRREATRRFQVETNNLYLSLHPGTGSAIEPFKRAHRLIDVLKAKQELAAMELKNTRRETHMDDPAVFDPDIEKVILSSDIPVTGGTDE